MVLEIILGVKMRKFYYVHCNHCHKIIENEEKSKKTSVSKIEFSPIYFPINWKEFRKLIKEDVLEFYNNIKLKKCRVVVELKDRTYILYRNGKVDMYYNDKPCIIIPIFKDLSYIQMFTLIRYII